jgi:hypothetical protein
VTANPLSKRRRSVISASDVSSWTIAAGSTWATASPTATEARAPPRPGCHSAAAALVLVGMNMLTALTQTTGAWIGIAITGVGLLLFAAPVVWLCLRFLAMDDDAVERTIDDVQRFVDLTDQARAELAAAPRLPLLDPAGGASATAAIDRFVARKELARKALAGQPQPPASTRAASAAFPPKSPLF